MITTSLQRESPQTVEEARACPSYVPGTQEGAQRPWCRWGDYSAATPDPVVPRGANTGRVWLTNQWVRTKGEPNKRPAKWGTWNWAAKP